jgi:maltose 6'-phosphate phosphatase
MELSLLTLNLHTYQRHPRDNPWATVHAHEGDVHTIAEAIAQQSIDVICFQEVGEYAQDLLTCPYGTVSSNMAYRIRQKLQFWGIHYHLFQDWSHVGFWIWREGTAILSRYPLHHSYSAYVSGDHRKDNYMSRNITMTAVDIPYFGLLHVSNVHMNWVHHGFHDEFRTLKWLVHTRRRFGFRGELIVGDFNAPAGEEGYQHIVGESEYIDQFYELHPHRFFKPTYQGKIDGWEYSEPKRIDYIFKRNGSPMRVKGFKSIFNESFYPMVSDHYGLVAWFELY